MDRKKKKHQTYIFLLLPANFHNSHLISVCVPLKENGVVWCVVCNISGGEIWILFINLFVYLLIKILIKANASRTEIITESPKNENYVAGITVRPTIQITPTKADEAIKL